MAGRPGVGVLSPEGKEGSSPAAAGKRIAVATPKGDEPDLEDMMILDLPRPPPSHRRSLEDHTMTWDFWIDRGGTFTDIVGRDPDGRAACPQAPVGKPGRLSRCGVPGHPRSPRARRRGADPAGPRRRRQDGHDRRHQRASRAQGRAHRADHHARVPRCARHRNAGASEDLRQAHRQARAALRAPSSRPTSGFWPTARSKCRSRRHRSPRSFRSLAAEGFRSLAIVFLHAWRFPAHEARAAAIAREMGFRPGLGQPRGEPALSS